MTWDDVLTYLQHRLSEKTTWIGLLSLLPLAGFHAHADAIATIGALAVAAFGVLIKDHKPKTILAVVGADAPVICNAIASVQSDQNDH